MKTTDAAAHFGSEYKLAKALGISQANITRWKTRVPLNWARHLNSITKGKLSFNLDDYPVKVRRK
jgi:DNA-binding transcriptional regulator YdaS (Cro superfamily)